MGRSPPSPRTRPSVSAVDIGFMLVLPDLTPARTQLQTPACGRGIYGLVTSGGYKKRESCLPCTSALSWQYQTGSKGLLLATVRLWNINSAFRIFSAQDLGSPRSSIVSQGWWWLRFHLSHARDEHMAVMS